MRYLLDTNICIYLIQVRPPEVLAKFRTLAAGDVVMSAVTFAELRHGIERCPLEDRASAVQALDALASRIPALPFDAAAGEHYGIIAAAVRDRRRDALDRLIAAHAIALGVVLVTNNEPDFRDYPGLELENWVAATKRDHRPEPT